MSNIFDLSEEDAPKTYDNISAMHQTFPWMQVLNPEQRRAVETTEGALLVLSGAGTGKTRVLTTRLAYILSNGLAQAYQCLVVTFTNKAAKEMKNRVQELIGSVADSVWLGTFHSVCVKILRRHAELVGLKSNFTILDEDDQKRVIKQILEAEGIDDKKYPPAALVEKISRFKDKNLTPEKIAKEFKGNVTTLVYQKYQARLKELNAVDFGDIIMYVLEIFLKHSDVLEEYQKKFRYIMVDEYQDTNVTQYLLLRLLAQFYGNICCVGDDDQSIYSWRGAEIENILRFENDFAGAEIIRLEQNYRSTHNILQAASNLIGHNNERLGKTLKVAENSPARQCDDEKIKVVSVYSGEEEALTVVHEIENLHRQNFAYSQMAILVRTAAQMRELEEKLISEAVPYQVIGGPKFYERAEIRDMVAYLRVIAQSADDLAFERIINKPARKIGTTSVKKFKDYAHDKHLSLFEAVREMSDLGLISGQLLTACCNLIGLFDVWKGAAENIKPAELVERVLEESGYMEMLKAENSPEADGRIDNLKELVNVMSDDVNYPDLQAFLEHVSLVTDTDAVINANNVMLMTLHSAKGLEFDVVFLPGWEEGLFPHERALNEGGEKALEEERRLAYVALTRAKQKLYILASFARKIFGQWENNQPSRFLNELPTPCLEIVNQAYPNYQKMPYQAKSATTYRAQNTHKSSSQQLKGARVFHESFGYGTLMRVEADNKCEVYFDKAGRKMIYGSYLRRV
ncbi:MAG: UvrD-helicase domain-containing protein [Alphaproteobacteria bacterium]|nr:UvrD-helicase domain-containing protein [Alphaproteobacteria bacterium]